MYCRKHVTGHVASCAPSPPPCGGLSREPAAVLWGGWVRRAVRGDRHAAIGLSKVTPGKSWHHICSRGPARSDRHQGTTRLLCAPAALRATGGRGGLLLHRVGGEGESGGQQPHRRILDNSAKPATMIDANVSTISLHGNCGR